MRALGVLLVLSGLAIAAFGFLTGTSDQASEAAVSSSREASVGTPTAVSETVYLPKTPAPAPTATVALQAAARLDLVTELQYELTRVGCYDGGINGLWTRTTRRAMDALIEKVNAKLPTTKPEPVHLALARGQPARICDRCPPGEDSKSSSRCARPATGRMLAAAIAPPRPPEPAAGNSRQRSPAETPLRGGRGPTDLAPIIAPAANGSARTLRMGHRGTCAQCGPCAMPTVGLEACLRSYLHGDPLRTAVFDLA
jgi:hypothetical protein